MSAATEIAARLCRPFEGLRLQAYICPAGVPTLGFGSTGPDIKLGMSCTPEWAEARLLRDLAVFEREVIAACPVLLTQPPERLAAVIDWTYNLGGARLRSSTLRKRINAGQFDDVPAELRKWVYGGGRKLPGLVKRREAEASLWVG